MILETGAVDRDGRMLIGPGCELTRRLIRVIEITQIPILYVTDESWEANKTCPEPLPLSEAQEEAMRDHFLHVDLEGSFARAVFDECTNMLREETTSTGGEAEEKDGAS